MLGTVLLYPVMVYEEKVLGRGVGPQEDPQAEGSLDEVPVA